MRIDEGLARAVFGPPPEDGQVWQVKPTTRFQLKRGLFDVGLIDSPPVQGAGEGAGRYDPAADLWSIEPISDPASLTFN